MNVAFDGVSSRQFFNALLFVTLPNPLLTSAVKTHLPSIFLAPAHLALRKSLGWELTYIIRVHFHTIRSIASNIVYTLPRLNSLVSGALIHGSNFISGRNVHLWAGGFPETCVSALRNSKNAF